MKFRVKFRLIAEGELIIEAAGMPEAEVLADNTIECIEHSELFSSYCCGFTDVELINVQRQAERKVAR